MPGTSGERAFGAPAGYLLADDPPPTFLRSVGMAGRPIPLSLQSEKRTQRPKLVAIAESPLRCDSAGRGPVLLPPRSARRLRRPRRCCSGLRMKTGDG